MHFESSRIAVLLPLWFSSSNDLNDWNGLRYQVSEAVEPFDRLKGRLLERLEQAAVLSLRDTLSDAGSCATCARWGCCRSPSLRLAA